MRKLRVLYVVNSLETCNGITSYVMNYFKNIDKEKIKIDFLICNSIGLSGNCNEEYIRNAGSKIFFVEQIGIKNFFKALRGIKNFFKENSNQYDIIHCHLLNNGAFLLHYAKKFKIKHRILHSHVTKSADTKLKKVRNDLLIPIAKKNATNFFACSNDAGKYIFKNNKFTIIKNAIEYKKFLYNEVIRDTIRKEMNLEGKFVYGNIGRLCPQKNQLFLLEIFKLIKEQQDNSKLVRIGAGPWKEKIQKKIKDLKLESDVILLQSTEKIQDMYQIFDMFLFPSNYEGLGIVLIEAQISGLKCLVSDMVPEETKLTEEYVVEHISNTAKDWANVAINFSKETYIRSSKLKEIIDNGYDIKTQTKKLEDKYIEIVGET